MASIKLEQFGGMLPAWDPHLLPNGQAAAAKNAYVFSGGLIGWRQPKLLRTLTNSAAKSAYRIPTITTGTANDTLTFKNNPNIGDQITVGEMTYTFNTDMTIPYAVLIGSSPNEAAQHFIAALTLDQGKNTGQGIFYGDGTSPNPDVDQFGKCTVIGNSNQAYVQAADIGLAYNATLASESTGGVRMSWATTPTFTGGINSSFDPNITGAALWLEFLDPDTTVLKTPIVDDQFNRFYWASPSQQPQYNTYDRIRLGQSPWLLGVNPPGCAPIVSVTGGGQTQLGFPTSTDPGTTEILPNNIFVMPITPPGAMSLDDVSFVPTNTSATGNFITVLYSDNGLGAPGILLNQSPPVMGWTAGATSIGTFVTPSSLLANQKYWIGVISDTDLIMQNGDTNSSAVSTPATYTNGPPASFAPVSGFNPVKVVSCVLVSGQTYTLTLDTPITCSLAAGPSVFDTLGFGPDPIGQNWFVIMHTAAIVGDTVLTVDFYLLEMIPPAGTVVVSTSKPTQFHGTPFAGANAHQHNVQMWGDLSTGSVIEARAYVYTWVTAYGEESPPSPATLVNGWPNGVWSVEMWSPPAEDMGILRNIKTARLYRTVSGVSGQTVFYWVCDLDIASNTITNVSQATGVLGGSVTVVGPGTIHDTVGDDVVALNTQLPSTTWMPPPEGLANIYNMPNGMMVGFRGNEIWFCEPYRPHAWPPQYTITTEFPIVGLGVSGQSVVAVTGGTPYIATGVAPGSMALTKLPISAPGLPNSHNAIVASETAVFYPSQMGLMQVGSGSQQVTNTTELWITREKWAQLVPQKNLRAVLQNSCYFCFGSVNGTDNSVAQTGFTIELNTGDSQSFTIWPQPGGHRLGFGQLTAPNGFDIVNMMNDPWTGITLIIQNNGVYYYDFTDLAPAIVPYDWTSKIYQQKNKESFAAMRVFFTVPPNTPAQNATRNTAATADPSWNTLQAGQYGIIYVYGDGNLVTTRELVSNGELLRIGSGQKYEQWQWRVQGRVLISNIQVATSVKELRNV